MIVTTSHQQRLPRISPGHPDRVNPTAAGKVLERIHEAESGREEDCALPGPRCKKDRVQPAAYTVSEFCEAFRLSRATFYNLRQRGEGPRLLRAGRKILVSTDAAADWIRRGEALASLQPTCGGEKAGRSRRT
jgi:Helix-turn-helix domain